MTQLQINDIYISLDYKRKISLNDKKPILLMISRMLTRKSKADLLTWVHLAYKAESSVKQSIGYDVQIDGSFSLKTQENTCEKSIKRSKK